MYINKSLIFVNPKSSEPSEESNLEWPGKTHWSWSLHLLPVYIQVYSGVNSVLIDIYGL